MVKVFAVQWLVTSARNEQRKSPLLTLEGPSRSAVQAQELCKIAKQRARQNLSLYKYTLMH